MLLRCQGFSLQAPTGYGVWLWQAVQWETNGALGDNGVRAATGEAEVLERVAAQPSDESEAAILNELGIVFVVIDSSGSL